MNILALDLGTTTGWARVDRNGIVAGGSESFAPRAHDSPGQRWLKFRRFLTTQREQLCEVHVVYYEDVKQHVGTLAAHVYGGFLALLEAWCAAHNIRLVPVGVGTVKKHWTGRGNAKKPDMIAAAQAKGLAPVDDNHADALAILSLALQREKRAAAMPF